jgi:ubiquinone/menaquinone biosynthesis C-methylase UbiE
MVPQPGRKQVYIHIGFPKTGTTSIQVWLSGNADALAAQGALYPVAGRGEGDYRFGHHLFPNALAQNPLSELATSWPDMDELHSEIANSAARTIILSSEDFATKLDRPAIHLLAHKLSDIDVRIICYVRRQDEFIISVWSTAVANYGEKNSLSDCLVQPWLDYAGTVGLWASAFGVGAIILRAYEESQLVGGDAVVDFLSVCGLDPLMDCGSLPQERHNQRLPAHIALILAYLNAHNVDRSVVTHLHTLGANSDGGNNQLQLLTPQERSALLARHAEGNTVLAQTYLGRADGRLFHDLTISGKGDCQAAQGTDIHNGLAAALALLINDAHAAMAPHPAVASSSSVAARDLPQEFRAMSDEAWLATLLQTTTKLEVRGFRFPCFPDPELQAAFVGTSDEATIREAFSFYIATRGYAEALGLPLALDRRFLDFGVGWGRFPRIFWKDISASNLYGCDVDPGALDLCKSTRVPGNFDRLYPRGRLPYPDSYFQAGIAYSVFTHLSEEAHLHWMRELARVLQPGAVFCMTLEPRRFAAFIEQLPDQPVSKWHQGLKKFAPHAGQLRAQFDVGQFSYMPTGGGTHREASEYGDAIVPAVFIEREWGHAFALRTYIDEPSRYWQAVAVMQRI